MPIDNAIALRVKPFELDIATPLMQAAKMQQFQIQQQRAAEAQQEHRANQAREAAGQWARGVAVYADSPEFPQRWAEGMDQLHSRGLMPTQAYQQYRNTPSPLMLQQIIAQTQTPEMAFRSQEAQRAQANADRSFGFQQSTSERDFALRERELKAKHAMEPWMPTPEGGLAPRPGGSADPAYQAKLTEGKDKTDEQIAARARAAKSYGMDPDDENTKAYILSGTWPKVGQDVLGREEAKKAVGLVDRYKSEADAGRGVLADVMQLRELRKGIDYEGGVGASTRATMGGWFGAGGGQALQSKAVDVQLGFSEKTKGAITDREQAMFGKATPGIEMSDAAAETVLTGMEAAGRRVVERGKFFENWLTSQRTLAGAQEAWDSFITDKPILSGDGKGGFKINDGNVTAWKSYVPKADVPARRSVAGKSAPQAPTTGDIPKEAIAYLKAHPNTAEQFDETFGQPGLAARILGVVR